MFVRVPRRRCKHHRGYADTVRTSDDVVENTDWRDKPCKPWPGAKNVGGYGKRKFRGKDMGAHRAEWIEKRGPIPPGMHVCHRCDNPPCREIAHLFLGTNRDNLHDMSVKGRSTWGTRNNTTKLTPENVSDIRQALALGATQRELGRRYGVSKSTIGYIARSETWQHWPERV
jgi:hypothetical protein